MENEYPSVSVIIPTFQSAGTIKEAIESALNQTVPIKELIVIDDGSTDETQEILEQYKQRIIILYQKNSGPASARNLGIKYASGEIIAFLDADDLWLLDKIENQISLFKNPNVDLVYGNVRFLYDSKISSKTYFDFYKPQKGYVFLPLFEQNFIPMLSVMVRKSCLDNERFVFDRDLSNVQDYDLFLRLAIKHQFDYYDNPVGIYRISKNQISKNFTKAAQMLLSVKERIYKENEGEFVSVKPNIIEKGLYQKYLRLAFCYLRDNKKDSAYSILKRYKVVKGKNLKYLIFAILLVLPPRILKLVIYVRDKIHQRPEFGYY
jgi:glycosyltransferase involved in cell wall biosynthesis